MKIQFVEAYKEFGGLIRGLVKKIMSNLSEISEIREEEGVIKRIRSKSLEFLSYHNSLGSCLVVYDQNLAKLLERERYIVLSDGSLVNVELWDYLIYEVEMSLISLDSEVIEKVLDRELLLEEEFDSYLELSFDGLNLRLYKNRTHIILPSLRVDEANSLATHVVSRLREAYEL
ncbi:MAG: hypothetical protein J7J75_02365 [Euryarchaeota archaeon]|nr:hypothetical protein [Euryarchaeota archaeon]MCD6158470.1 hypothetical protein [Euryarchaeota archaeon]